MKEADDVTRVSVTNKFSKKTERGKKIFSPAVVFALCAIFTLLAFAGASRLAAAENGARFDRSASSLHDAFKARMAIYVNALVYTRNLLTLKPDLTPEEFRTFVRGMKLEEEFPGLGNVGYVKRFGLSVSPERRIAMEKAADLGVPVATDRGPQDSGGDESSFLVFVPHYRKGAPVGTVEERRRALRGFIYGGFRAPILFGSIAGDAKMQDGHLALRVLDGDAKTGAGRIVYAKGDLAETDPRFFKEIPLRAADRDWRILLGARSDFAPFYSRFLPLLILFVGTILTLAVTFSAWRAQVYAGRLGEDIEARRSTEAQLRDEKQIVELTSKIGTTLKAEQDLESIVQMVTDVGTELTGAKFGAFFYNIVRDDGKLLALYSLSGADKSIFEKLGMPRNTDVFRPTFDGTAIMRVDDILADPRYGRMGGMPKGHLPVRSYLSAPVVSKSGKVLGGLLFGHPEPGVFTARAEGIVRSLAIQAAVAMDNANLYREISQARAAADKANSAKSLFLANVSHEIRTPLGIMLGFAELTAEMKDDPVAVEENVTKILRSGRELTRILGDVLDLSKIEANALLIETSEISFGRYLSEVVADWRPRIEDKGLVLETSFAADLPVTFVTDPTRLNQILVNLLANALKFTERGKIRLAVERAPATDGAPGVALRVMDSGPGIADEQKSRLFKAFSQGDSSITRRYGGSGLGLALSEQLARALGGELTLVSSEIGVGSTFALTLPVTGESSEVRHPTTPMPAPLSLNSLRILLVEDSLDNQMLIRTILKKVNAIVETAENGEEGVRKALSSDYGIVLMDMQMPVLDGYGAFEKLKAAGYKRPVIALTAHSLISEKRKATAMGFYDYLTKPVNREMLVSVIARAASAPSV